jgi:hypothetical protein
MRGARSSESKLRRELMRHLPESLLCCRGHRDPHLGEQASGELKCGVSNIRTRMLATHEHVISGGRLLSRIWDP